jgi:hypothetical protein
LRLNNREKIIALPLLAAGWRLSGFIADIRIQVALPRRRRPDSGLSAVLGGKDDLRHEVAGHAQFARYLGRPQSLLVVQQGELLL